jgi:hypothetical protein
MFSDSIQLKTTHPASSKARVEKVSAFALLEKARVNIF